MIVAIIIVLAIAFVLLTLGLKRQRSPSLDRDQQNIEIVRQEFIDLKAQHEAGEITDAQYQQMYDELVVMLGTDLQSAPAETSSQTHFGQRTTLIGVFVILAVLTPLLYFYLGSPQALHPPSAQTIEQAHEAAGMNSMPSIEAMVEGLRQKLEKDPKNLKGWLMLGRSYMVLKQYDRAVDALSKAYALDSEDSTIQLFYADALTMQNGGQTTDKAFKLIENALAKNPENTTAMWMAAIAYEKRGDYKTAVDYWKRLLPKLQSNSSDYQEVQMRLAHAEARLTGKPMTIPAPTSMQEQASNNPAPTASPGASVTAVIKLDAKYQNKVQPTDTVFVFARAVNGPRQPLAAKRLQVKDLPATITLDDSMAMSPMNKLSDYAQVYIGARVSHSGNVMPSSGDLQGRSNVVATNKPGQTIHIMIDQEIM